MKELFDYMEGLIIGQGREAGKKLQLFPWQKRFLRGAFGQPDDAALSLARGGGKTTFTAGLAAACLNGPLAERRAEVLLVAASFEQGLIAFRHVLDFLQPAMEKRPNQWRVWDSQNRAMIRNNDNMALLRVLGCDPRRMMGAAPKLLLLDELASWPETLLPRALSALETSRGKIPGSKALYLGTRAASPDHPFEMAFKTVGYSQVHAAGPSDSDKIFQRRTWKKANPGLDRLPDLEIAIRQEAKRAKMDSSALARFKSLRLNMGVPDHVSNILLDVAVWQSAEAEEIERRGPYICGIDLGQNVAMSAAAGFWMDTNALDGFAVFPEEPNLHERGLADGVDTLYVKAAERGELLQAGHLVSDIPTLLSELRERWGMPAAIVCDRHRQAEMRQCLIEADFPVIPLIIRGMGWVDGAEDVRAFRKAALTDHLTPRQSVLMRAAIGGARVMTNSAGDPKLAKGGEGRRTRCRDDLAAASILAVAEGRRRAIAAAAKTAISFAVV